MAKIETALQMSNGIRSLALRAVEKLSSSQFAYRIAKRRTVCPVDYMRYAEFDALARDLKINSQINILDVSSPQWLSLYLADKNPGTKFHYINILDSDLDPYRDIAHALGIKNLIYQKADARNMEFNDNIFDKVISISVIEHIYPEEDGDLRALLEIKRVLKSEGFLFLTIPYKAKRNIIYMNGPVYERHEKTKNFFAREYDAEMLSKLIERSGFSLSSSWFICEKKGLFPLDYYEWGPGKDALFAKSIISAKNILERITKNSCEGLLAKRYLDVSHETNGRLVNISIKLKNKKNQVYAIGDIPTYTV